MKHSKSALLILLIISIQIISVPVRAADSLSDQIGASVSDRSFKQNKKTHSVIFEVETKLTNNSDISLMQIEYSIHFLNKSGEEIRAVSAVFNGQDTPLKPGESITHTCSGQFPSDVVPSGIRLEVTGTVSEADMPPIHVPQAGEYLYQAVNDPHLNNIKEEAPVSVSLWIDRGGARSEGTLSDPEEIAAFLEAFTQVKIAAMSNTWVTDNYNGLSFTFADGKESFISLNLNALEYRIYKREYVFDLKDDKAFRDWMYTRTSETVYEDVSGGS